MIPVTLNGQPRELAADLTIEKLLQELGVPRPGTAVAINDTIVPRDQHASHAITAGDRVEVLRAIGGG